MTAERKPEYSGRLMDRAMKLAAQTCAVALVAFCMIVALGLLAVAAGAVIWLVLATWEAIFA